MTLFPHPHHPEPSPLQQQFEDYHRAHPEVLARIVELARARRLAGHRRYSMKAIFERMRWDGLVDEINNNWHAFYARRAVEVEPELAGFFEMRRQRVEYVAGGGK
jgi:hypothetical protein